MIGVVGDNVLMLGVIGAATGGKGAGAAFMTGSTTGGATVGVGEERVFILGFMLGGVGTVAGGKGAGAAFTTGSTTGNVTAGAAGGGLAGYIDFFAGAGFAGNGARAEPEASWGFCAGTNRRSTAGASYCSAGTWRCAGGAGCTTSGCGGIYGAGGGIYTAGGGVGVARGYAATAGG